MLDLECMQSLHEDFEPIAFAKKEAFIPGELYAVNKNWTFFDKPTLKGETSTNIPAMKPFMFLGIIDTVSPFRGPVQIVHILIGDEFGYYELEPVLRSLNSYLTTLYRVKSK